MADWFKAWRPFLYSGHVTLTSLGYGDALPAGFYAQSLAAFVAVEGVPHTAILLPRSEGVHHAQPA